jgi:hypothetical protein
VPRSHPAVRGTERHESLTEQAEAR